MIEMYNPMNYDRVIKGVHVILTNHPCFTKARGGTCGAAEVWAEYAKMRYGETVTEIEIIWDGKNVTQNVKCREEKV